MPFISPMVPVASFDGAWRVIDLGAGQAQADDRLARRTCSVPCRLSAEIISKEQAPKRVIGMHGRCRLAVSEDRTALVRPGEDAAAQVANLGNAGCSQRVDDGRASIADGAIDHDSGPSIDRYRREIAPARIDSDGAANMTDREFFFAPHVEQYGRARLRRIDPFGERLGVDPFDVGKPNPNHWRQGLGAQLNNGSERDEHSNRHDEPSPTSSGSPGIHAKSLPWK